MRLPTPGSVPILEPQGLPRDNVSVKNTQRLLHRESPSLRGPVKDLILRFVIGGIVVSVFAALGDVLKPKSFAGLFGAAPSIALATLGLTIAANGKIYAATEARSMIAGALAFFLYAYLCSWLMVRRKLKGMPVTLSALGLWLVGAISIWFLVLR
jgi:hypothetical protein